MPNKAKSAAAKSRAADLQQLDGDMNQIHLLRQEHDTGCGVACVAMCAGWSYEDAFQRFKRVLRWGERKRSFYTQPSQLVRILDNEKIPYLSRKSGEWADVDGTAIVGVNREKGYWHWVVAVKDEQRFLILDPETGEIYRYTEWADHYRHGPGQSKYFRFGSAAKAVLI